MRKIIKRWLLNLWGIEQDDLGMDSLLNIRYLPLKIAVEKQNIKIIDSGITLDKENQEIKLGYYFANSENPKMEYNYIEEIDMKRVRKKDLLENIESMYLEIIRESEKTKSIWQMIRIKNECQWLWEKLKMEIKNGTIESNFIGIKGLKKRLKYIVAKWD